MNLDISYYENITSINLSINSNILIVKIQEIYFIIFKYRSITISIELYAFRLQRKSDKFVIKFIDIFRYNLFNYNNDIN